MVRAGLLVSSCVKMLEILSQKGGTIKDEWNSGCDRPKLWQVYGKLVGSELNELIAAEGQVARYGNLGIQKNSWGKGAK